MSPELRKRIEKAQKRHCWQNVSLDFIYEAGFHNGAKWMHENEVVPRNELIEKLSHGISFCLTGIHKDFMSCQSRAELERLKVILEKFEQGKGGEG